MPTKQPPSIEDDLPIGSVAKSLLHRLRTAALPPKQFARKDDEQTFIKRYQEDGMLAYSVALLIGGITLLGFFVAHAIEGVEYGSNRPAPQVTRLLIAISLIALAYLLLSKKRWFLNHFDHIGPIGPIIAIVGVAFLPFTMLENAAIPGFPFARFFLSLATTIWICFAFSRISRDIIILTSIIASIALSVFAIHHNYAGAYFSSMHLIVAIWAGWALSVLIEKRERQTFMSHERMSIESNAMAENVERADLINEMQADALQTIAHDIRQPLLSLGLYADIIGSKYSEIPEVKKFSEKIRSCLTASENSITIVENVLHSAGVASQLDTKQIALARPLTMLDVVFFPILSAAGVRLALPNIEEQQIGVWTNEHALNEILFNLVSNANRHAWQRDPTASSKCISVTISTIDDDFVDLTVSDNGQGIESTDLERIFEKGFQVHARSNETESRGLGLSIVQGLVNKLPRHTISVQSSSNGGTAFHILVPRNNPLSSEA